MHEGEHFGVIPGTEKKDSAGKDISKRVLLKSGADLLCSLFQLVADYETLETIRTPTLIYYRLKCTLTSANSGIRRGSGLGSCNSQEEKYIRAAAKKCPNCGKDTIIKGREEYGGGWICYAKKGGCGGKWKDGDATIEQQETGIKDPADLDNTILKMAAKRSRVDAVLTVTGASDFFTQDVEDLTEREAEYIPPPKASADPKAEGRSQGQGPTTPDGPLTSAATSGSKAQTAGASVGTKPPAVHYEKDPVIMAKATRLLQQLGWAKPHAVNWLKKHFQADSFAKLTAEQSVTAVEKLEMEVEAALAEEERKVAEATKGQTK